MKKVNNMWFFKLLSVVLVAAVMVGESLPATSAKPMFSLPATPAPFYLGGISVFDTYLSVSFGWYDNSDNESGFRIQEKQGIGGTYSQVASPSANMNNYGGITIPRDGSTYYFRIKAYNGDGESAASNEVGIDTDTAEEVPPPLPNTPSAFQLSGVTVLSTTYSLAFTWTDNSSDETGFHIEKKQGVDGTYFLVATPSANSNNYGGITVPKDGNTYYFRIKAFNANGESAPSDYASFTATP
jgi:hypothetical protein